METGSSILGYKGDANLGIGADAGIPVSGGGDLSAINDMAKNIMLEEHQNNINLFNQKIKDRDALLQAIDDGEISVGDIRPEDRKFFDEYKNKADKAMGELINGGGIKNEVANKKYKDSIRDLKDVTTMLQSRKVERVKLDNQLATSKLPTEQNKIKEHIKKEDERLAKDPFETYNPFQLAVSANFPAMFSKYTENSWSGGAGTTPTTTGSVTAGGVIGTPTTTTQKTTTTSQAGKQPKTTTTTTTAPVKGKQSETPVGEIVVEGGRVYDIKRSYVDANIIRKNTLLDTEDEESSIQQRLHLKYIQNPLEANPSMTPEQAAAYNKDYVEHIINQVQKYNSQRGFVPQGKDASGRPIFTPEQIKQGAVEIQGKFIPNDPKNPNMGYKINMTPDEFAAVSSLASIDNYVAESKEYNEGMTKELRLGAESKAKIRATNALASQRRANAHLAGKKAQLLDKQFNPIETFDDLFKGGIHTVDTQNGNRINRINVNSMPKGLVDNLGITPLDSDGNYNVVPSNIKFKGTVIPEEYAWDNFSKWKDGEEAKKMQTTIGKEPDIFDYLYSLGGTFETDVIGKIAPKYVKGKGASGTETMILANPNEAGKITRSNRLTSWINQRKELGVKGSKLLMQEGSEGGEGYEQPTDENYQIQ